ncbi:PIG-L deacetylase family protein [Brachybacterium conglomeratum]|uniref:PIG-L deacetylase family protein n=1 Tax=Brachybacterium conglomeratum TaxID=47846 RepID=UPI003DA0C43B
MRIMTVYAHPADTITNCGGTLALHADAGDEIVAVILTHGGRIHPNVYAEEARKEDADPDLLAADRAEIIENKKGELRRAAEIVGIGTIEFLDHDDAISVVREDMVDEVAEMIAKHRPDAIIADYPQNPAVTNSAHTIATMTLIAALDRASQFLTNIDGKEEVNVKQVFLGGLPVLASDALSTYGVRNDLFIDITSVVGRKVAAMDCFTSQGYDGPFARKLIEASNGEFGRSAGVALAEPYVRFRGETRSLLPLTDYAEAADPLTRHVSYSQFDVRRAFPLA